MKFSENITQVNFFPLHRVKPPKKFLPQFGTIFGRNWRDSFVLTGTFLSDHPALKSRWGTINLDWGTLTLDGGRVPPAI